MRPRNNILNYASRPIDDPRVYEIWLRARQEASNVSPEGLTSAISLVNQAQSIVGDNALFDAALGYFHCLTYDSGISHDDQTLQLAEDLAARALKENPELSLALNATGWVRYKRGDFKGTIHYFRRAAGVDRNIDALWVLGFWLAEAGMTKPLKSSIRLRQAKEVFFLQFLSFSPQVFVMTGTR